MRFLKLSIIALLLAHAGCHKSSNGGERARHSGPVRIGLSFDSLQLERWQHDRDALVSRAKELGADVAVQSADGQDSIQVKQCENLLTGGVDVLIIVPHNAEVMASAVSLAKAQGVPVLSYDRLVRNADVDLYVSFDNRRVGQMQAKYLLDHAPKGNYILIGGSPTDNNAHLVRDGQMDILKPAIDRGDVKIVADQWAKDWLPSEALRHTENALTQAANNVVAVVASNDSTAGGVVQALAEQKLAGKVLVSGQDADLAATQRIAAGTQSMTVYKPIAPLATRAAETAVALAKGEKITISETVNNGKKDVEAILLQPITVDKTNLNSTVIRDGFLKMQDIYHDIPASQVPKDTQ